MEDLINEDELAALLGERELDLVNSYMTIASLLCPPDMLNPYIDIKISTPNRVNSGWRKAFIVNANVPIRAESKIGRNDVCICGSGKKYKHCCLTNP